MYSEIVRPSDDSKKTYLWVGSPGANFFYISRMLTPTEIDYLLITGGLFEELEDEPEYNA